MGTNEHDKKIIGEKLRELRISHGYSQIDIASFIDVTQGAYSQYESGIRSPSPITLYKIANFYGLSIDELLRLCLPLDDEIFYDAKPATSRSLEEADFSSFASSKRLEGFSTTSKEILYCMSKLSPEKQWEVIGFAKSEMLKEKSRKQG